MYTGIAMKGIAGRISVEKKLELVQMMRNESQNNRIKMRGREQILYGRKPSRELVLSAHESEAMSGDKENDPLADGPNIFRSFKVRLLIAGILFAAFVAWDNGYYPMLPARTEEFYRMISDDMLSANIFAFVEDFTYTLK